MNVVSADYVDTALMNSYAFRLSLCFCNYSVIRCINFLFTVFDMSVLIMLQSTTVIKMAEI